MNDTAFLLYLLNMLVDMEQSEQISVKAWNKMLFAIHDYFKSHNLREDFNASTVTYSVIHFVYAKDE